MNIEQFNEAQKRVLDLKERPSNEVLLDLYGLFKQASAGDVQEKRPGFLDIKGRAKYDAWFSRKGMPKEKAIEAYVALVNQLLQKD